MSYEQAWFDDKIGTIVCCFDMPYPLIFIDFQRASVTLQINVIHKNDLLMKL